MSSNERHRHKHRHRFDDDRNPGGMRHRHGGPFGGPGRGGPGRGGPGREARFWFGGPGPEDLRAFMAFGPGGGRGRARRRRGDVRAALLLLLAEEPRNGYQLMQTLEERSEGRWRPSPGSVYPALSQLEDEGFVRSVQSDSGRTFEITDAGREHLQERGDHKPPWEQEDDEDLDTFRSFGRVIASTAKAAAQVAQERDPQQIAKATEILTDARRKLYLLLADAEEPTDE
jgi:DNA-binding PadR family transcriptional regulator